MTLPIHSEPGLWTPLVIRSPRIVTYLLSVPTLGQLNFATAPRIPGLSRP